MTDWEQVPVTRVATVSWGDTSMTKAAYIPDGVPAYSASGNDGFVAEAQHSEPAVVISAIGAQCGKQWLTGPEWTAIKNTLWMKSIPGASDIRFLHYATSDPNGWPRRGAAQPFISLGDAKQRTILLPPLELQSRIADVLAAFDELIEKNRRRVEVLEETARSLFREWFVRYRFPGHESVEFVDADVGPIPSTWSVEPFSEVGDYVNGFAFKPSHWQDEGTPIIKIKELKNGVTRSTPRYAGDDIKEKYRVCPGDLLFSWSGDLDAYLWPGPEGWLNQHLFLVQPRKVPRVWLFLALRDRMDEFRRRSQGTTMKHIQRSALSQVRVSVPDVDALSAFEAAVSPVLGLSVALQGETAAVMAARDRILPKLVMGQIEVESLGVDDIFGWAEVAEATPAVAAV